MTFYNLVRYCFFLLQLFRALSEFYGNIDCCVYLIVTSTQISPAFGTALNWFKVQSSSSMSYIKIKKPYSSIRLMPSNIGLCKVSIITQSIVAFASTEDRYHLVVVFKYRKYPKILKYRKYSKVSDLPKVSSVLKILSIEYEKQHPCRRYLKE